MSEDAQVTLIKTTLTAALGTAGSTPALDADDVKARKAAGSLPAKYVEVYLSRRYSAEGQRVGGNNGLTYYRLSTRVVADTVSNARTMEDRIRQALEEKSITVADRTSTGFEHESSDVIGPDDGRYSALTVWTYVL